MCIRDSAYALRAKDAWGNDIISSYDVKIVATNQALAIDDAEADVVYTSPAKLDELFAGELAKVAAHYYTKMCIRDRLFILIALLSKSVTSKRELLR